MWIQIDSIRLFHWPYIIGCIVALFVLLGGRRPLIWDRSLSPALLLRSH